MATVEKFVKVCKENSIKITPQRLSIFKILDGNTSHPSAEDIYKELLKEHPTISYATVYNTLDKLHEMNMLLELNIEGEKKHFDPNTNQHHHFLCRKCRKIFDIFEAFEVNISEKNDLEVDGYQIYFYGTCKNCTE